MTKPEGEMDRGLEHQGQLAGTGRQAASGCHIGCPKTGRCEKAWSISRSRLCSFEEWWDFEGLLGSLEMGLEE